MAQTLIPPTPKQREWIERLAPQQGIPQERLAVALACKTEASRLLEQLFAADRSTRAAAARPAAAVVEPGFYVHGDRLYKVQESRSTGRLYALVLEVAEVADGPRKGRFVYAPHAIFALHPAEKLTHEQAARMGHAYGFCVRCTISLDDPRSAAVGYGQRCARKMGWPYPTHRQALALIAAAAV